MALVVEYVDDETSAVVGTEVHNDLEAVLLPKIVGNGTFTHKCFAGHGSIQWRVVSVTSVAGTPAHPDTTYTVTLRRHVDASIEYLSDTIARPGQSLGRLIKVGKLVEVDYGFIQQVGDAAGGFEPSGRWIDGHLAGEMHKRRLAVVAKVGRSTLQVLPVTSKEAPFYDRSRFEISPSTLGKLSFYGASGLRSWALTDMLSSVSFQRVLPPSVVKQGRFETYGSRDRSYPVFISTAERTLMRDALGHVAGVHDYESLRKAVSADALERADLESRLRRAEAALDEQSEAMRLTREVAEEWRKQYDLPSLEGEVAALRQIYSDCASPGT